MKTETELAALVCSALSEWKWDIYQEVIDSPGRCDIVAKRENILWAIECKLSFGLPVIAQAYRWMNRANYVSIAVKSSPGGGIGRKFCKDYGIGILAGRHEIVEIVRPKLHRKIKPIKLVEEQKTWGQAGTNGGNYYTPFKSTVSKLVAAVKANPGIEFNQLIKMIDHHYRTFSTAKSCLRGFIDTEVIPGIEAKIVNKKLCVFPKQTTLKQDYNHNT